MQKNIKLFSLLILFLLLSGTAGAETITLNPCSQDDINTALKNAGENGTVILTAGEYPLKGPVYVPRNINLIGEPGAKFLVSSDISSPWFSPTVGAVNLFDPFNNTVKGFEIDGNCLKLNNDWANSPGHAHDQEQLIKAIGSRNNFGKNIIISNMTLRNAFGDGIQARCIDGIICESNTIINCQHESIYFSASKHCFAFFNEMAVITSDGVRYDNCLEGESKGNKIWKYSGDSNGAYKGGANGFQVGDAQVSKGYDGRKDWITTKNITIHDNIISDPGRQGVLLDDVSRNPASNVYVHDNIFVNTTELRTMGVHVDDYSINNPPSMEESEKIFEKIYDIQNLLSLEYPENAVTQQTADQFSYKVIETENGKIAGGIKILGFNNLSIIDNQSYISDPKDAIIKTSVIRNPSLDLWFGGIEDIQRDVNISIENDTLTATMTVKMTWYNYQRNKLGKLTAGKLQTSIATFNDSYYPAPRVIEQPAEIKGIIYQYSDHFDIKALKQGICKDITYQSGDNTSKQVFLVGTRNQTAEGVKYTEYSRLEHWEEEGNLTRFGDWIQVNRTYDPSIIQVTASTPYKKYQVTEFEIIEKEAPKEPINPWFYAKIVFWVFLSITIRFYWNEIKSMFGIE